MRGGLSVGVPRRGTAVVATALYLDGGEVQFVVATDAAGTTRVLDAPDDRMGAPAASTATTAAPAGSPAACADGQYNLNPSKWHTTYRWWFRARSTPNGMRKTSALNALKQAVGNITHERNDCGRLDHVSATSSYQGTTTRQPGVSSTGCGATDGRNVVAFGSLPANVLGFTCVTYLTESRRSIEADMLLNRGHSWTIGIADCIVSLVLEAIATHEFGHVYGLGHVSEAGHGELTMSRAVGACDAAPSTLGLGDMLGLEARY